MKCQKRQIYGDGKQRGDCLGLGVRTETDCIGFGGRVEMVYKWNVMMIAKCTKSPDCKLQMDAFVEYRLYLNKAVA
jgi:hypothetical protein